jgi:hypothetical protein
MPRGAGSCPTPSWVFQATLEPDPNEGAQGCLDQSWFIAYINPEKGMQPSMMCQAKLQHYERRWRTITKSPVVYDSFPPRRKVLACGHTSMVNVMPLTRSTIGKSISPTLPPPLGMRLVVHCGVPSRMDTAIFMYHQYHDRYLVPSYSLHFAKHDHDRIGCIVAIQWLS